VQRFNGRNLTALMLADDCKSMVCLMFIERKLHE